MECITGPLSKMISTQGMQAVYESLDAAGKKTFQQVDFTPAAALLPCSVCGPALFRSPGNVARGQHRIQLL